MKKIILNINFTHLRIYSEYSLKDGIINLKELIKQANLNKLISLAITDKNFFAVIEFYKLCIENNIKPIIGCDLFLENKFNRLKPFELLLLVKNKSGYLNLIKLISKSNLYKVENNFPEIKKSWLKGQLSKGLVVITSYKNNDIFDSFIKKDKNLLKSRIKFWLKYFKNRFYLEIQRCEKSCNYLNNEFLKLSKIYKIPLVATHPNLFIKKTDYILYKIKKSIINNNDLNNCDKKNLNKNCFFYSVKKMINLFKDIPSSLINSCEISKKCNLNLDLDKIKIPIFKRRYNNHKYFLKLSLKLLKVRLKNFYPNFNFKKDFIKYKSRLFYECKIIITMNVTDYFLIVRDFINWAKIRKIPVGPGRGSSAGSLISFSLSITELDPLKNNLIFERFLNFKRLSIPDFDIDFCPFKRFKVINYVKLKYGIANISQIITFGKLTSKSSLKDIGRVLKFNYSFMDKIIKLIPFKYNNKSIIEILENVPDVKNEYKNNFKIQKLFNLAIRLENNIKNIGIHAGGVIISPNKLYNFCPLSIQNDILISQFSKTNIEKIGLLKFDFLGLNTLSIIDKCIEIINKNYKIFLLKFNLKDKLCFDRLKKANTVGVFQLESPGMRNLLKNFQPDSIENLIALISLYRPGPIKLLDSFCLRRFGKEKITYINENLESILKETYGIIIYQEQIIFIAQVISNFSLENADILRVAISKKKPEDMINLRLSFIKGGLINGYSEKLLNEIFDKIDKFAGYGFNKSHATAYSMLSYHTLWLKTYYFPQFICSTLSHCFNDFDKIDILINESFENNTFILPLNINKSQFYFKFIYGKINKIRYGFFFVKGVGENVVKEIIKVRKIKNFISLLDFYERVNKNVINYKVFESLICSGAFDSININRAELLNEFKNLFYKLNFCLKNITKSYIKFYFTDNFFWSFKIKLIEENLRLGFFYINNLLNIYINKFNFILKKFNCNLNYINNNCIFGIIKNFQKRFDNKELFYLVWIYNKNQNYRIKVDIDLYIKNFFLIKNYNFIIIFINKKEFYITANKIYNIDNFKNFKLC